MTEGPRAASPDSRRTTGAWPFVTALILGSACLPPATSAVVARRSAPPEELRALPLRPPLAVVVRDGDPRAALAVAVLTAGVEDAAGARVPVALAAVTEARLAADGLHDVTVAPTWDGYRIRALLPASGDSAPVVRAVREALLAPVAPSDVVAAAKRLSALANRPLHDPALADVARCTDAPAAEGHESPAPAVASLERWRSASQGLGRVVFGAVGTAGEIEGIASALLAQPAWPSAAARTRAQASTSSPLVVYDAGGDVAPSAARVTVVAHTTSAAIATRAAAALGALDGPVASRLLALDTPVTLHDVTATAHAGGGCVAVTLELAHVDRRRDAENAIAAAASLVRQEARLAIGAASGRDSRGRSATLAGDPREAAELAAWWALVDEGPVGQDPQPQDSVAIGLGVSADASVDFAARARDVAGALERADVARQARVVDVRSAIERGQGAVWILLGSPCGTLDEGDADAGLTALAVSSLAEQARVALRGDAEVSEWISSEGVGLVVRAARKDGETSSALAARAADTLGAAFMAGTVEESAIAHARAALMTTLADGDARSFVTLAEALTPGHPSWSFPLATGRGLEGWPDGAVVARVSALRHGPLRLAILGNEDAAQVDAAVQEVDRWVPRPPGASRTCAPHATLVPARPGTYVAPAATPASAWLAIPLPAGSRDAGATVAAALDGPDGLLARVLSSGLASAWSARVVGPSDASALVLHVVAPAHALDAAVAEVRALLDRLRQGAFTDDDRARAAASLAHDSLVASLDPRQRLLRLWRGDVATPSALSLDALRTFLARDVRDESLVIVAARPPKPAP